MVLPDHPDTADRYATAGTLQRYDIGLTPTLYSVPAGDHLQFVLTTQAPTSDCASLLSALTTPLPCILSTPQKKTSPEGCIRSSGAPYLTIVAQCSASSRGDGECHVQRCDADQSRID